MRDVTQILIAIEAGDPQAAEELNLFTAGPNLILVEAKKTKVTEAGVQKVAAALPGCKIEWDGGVIEPAISPDREAAEWVLSVGGRLEIKQGDVRRCYRIRAAQKSS